MELDQIKEFICFFQDSKLQKLTYKKDSFELHLEKPSPVVSSVSRSVTQDVEFVVDGKPHVSSSAQKEEAGAFVTSPMVGTFYASPSPDQPSFVKSGDRVSEGTIVCIVEAMKVMNEVRANMEGTIVEVLVHSGQPVEYGTRLFRIVNS